MSDHARFSPSSMPRLLQCPGSVALTRDAPDTTNIYSAEGTAAHYLAARALTYDKPASFFLGEQIDASGYVFTVDEVMSPAVQIYLDEVNARVGDGALLVEQKVSFSQAIGVPDQFGTADAVILSGDGKRLSVGDLKYGLGVKVYAKDNAQLLTYGLGTLETFDVVLDLSALEEIELWICQPRLEHIDSWTVSVDQLRAHAAEIRLAAHAALEGCDVMDATGVVPDELLRPSESACRFCKARATCPKLRETVAAVVFDDFKALDEPDRIQVQGDPAVPPPDRLGEIYGVLDLIENWCRSVRGEVERMVLAGMTILGPDGLPMKLVEGKKGNRSWRDEEQARDVLCTLLGPDKAYQPPKLVTPSAVEKTLGKKRKAEFTDLIAPLTAQAPGRPKVVLGSFAGAPYHAEAGSAEFEDLDGGGGAE
jgi:hypothetical protein